MQYFIKEWPDRTASIIAEDGHLLATLNSLKEALHICRKDCRVEPMSVASHFSYLQSSPVDFEHSFVDAA